MPGLYLHTLQSFHQPRLGWVDRPGEKIVARGQGGDIASRGVDAPPILIAMPLTRVKICP